MKLISPIKLLIQCSRQNLLLPFYHTVSNNYLPHIHNLYPVRNVSLFTKDLDFFCKHYSPISLNELEKSYLTNTKFTKPVFHLTFDDGLSEIHSIISPILLAKGIPATFFINSGFIDNQDLFYRYKVSLIIEKLKNESLPIEFLRTKIDEKINSVQMLVEKLKAYNFNQIEKIDKIGEMLEIDFKDFLKTTKPYLTTQEIQELLAKGFTIGSHSVSHPHYKDISDADRKQQTKDCFQTLNQKFNISASSFAFPFNDESIPVYFFKWLYETQHCSTSFGTSGLKHDLFKNHFHRIPMEKSLESSDNIISKEYWYYLLKFFLLKNKISRHD